jgi:4'-phosphopantetheinyl transferase EntD
MTHCAGYRAAAVARTDHLLALGIDAEPHAPLPAEVLQVVAHPQEAALLAALSSSDNRVSWDRLLFSAKESLFKAWYPLTGRWLDFEDVALRIDPLDGTFVVALQVEPQALGGLPADRYSGRWLVAGDLVLTTITVSSDRPPGDRVVQSPPDRLGRRPSTR